MVAILPRTQFSTMDIPKRISRPSKLMSYFTIIEPVQTIEDYTLAL